MLFCWIFLNTSPDAVDSIRWIFGRESLLGSSEALREFDNSEDEKTLNNKKISFKVYNNKIHIGFCSITSAK